MGVFFGFETPDNTEFDRKAHQVRTETPSTSHGYYKRFTCIANMKDKKAKTEIL